MTAGTLLVFARCAGFAFRAPGIAHPSVAPPVRAALALLLTFVLTARGGGTSPAHLDAVALVVAVATEFLLGSAIGMAASALYDGAYAGGRAIDDYVGVKAFAPSAQLVAPSGFGRLWSLACTGAYVLTGAYRLGLLGFARSFDALPPGAPVDARLWAAYAARVVTTVAVTAASVAAPSIAFAFVAQIATGALARAVPRFGGPTLAMPLAFAAALIAAALALPAVLR